MTRLFAIGGQSTEASALALVFPMNIQGFLPLGLTGLISLLSKGLSRIVSNTTVQKHRLFGAQPSSYNSHIHTWKNWKNYSFAYVDLCWQGDVSAF